MVSERQVGRGKGTTSGAQSHFYAAPLPLSRASTHSAPLSSSSRFQNEALIFNQSNRKWQASKAIPLTRSAASRSTDNVSAATTGQ